MEDNKNELRILYFGDIFASSGVKILGNTLPKLKERYKPHIVCANGENATGGRGINKERYSLLRSYGIDVITTGNHAFAQKDVLQLFQKCDEPILLPANFPCVERSFATFTLMYEGIPCTFINLLGRTYMQNLVDCPFKTLDLILDDLPQENIVIVDFHAEATSEKKALAYYADGRITALVGTHTHVQTHDATILPKGTGFITDIGMCGVEDSILGMDKVNVIQRFKQGYNTPFFPAKGAVKINGVLITIDTVTKSTVNIEYVVH